MPTLPRLPLIPDPLRRIHVPRELGPITTVAAENDAAAAGLEPGQVDRIWEAAVSLFRAGVHPALQLCVRRNGHVVLDRAIGHARGNGPRDSAEEPKVLASTDTPFCVYSTSKGITAFVVHTLADRGAFAIDDRVTDFIPEYGRHGKGETTIGHVLAHRAGVASLPRELLDLDRLGDRELIVEKLSDAKPSSAPGKLLAYHAVTGGFILGEIVQRVTGRSIRDVLATEILEPLAVPVGQLRRRARGPRRGRAQLRDRRAGAAAAVVARSPARSGGRWRRRSSCRTIRAS